MKYVLHFYSSLKTSTWTVTYVAKIGGRLDVFLEEGGLELPLFRIFSGHGIELDHRVFSAGNVSVIHPEISGQAVAATDGAVD
jgi:hypothetical protein